MEWLHCNTCFVQPGDVKMSFKLTSCGHIYCSACLQASQKDGSKKCKTCGQMYQGVLPLSNQMKPDTQIWFTDLKELMKKQIQVLEFQRGHNLRLANYRKKQLKQAVGTALRDQSKEIARLQQENQKMKQILMSMGYNVRDGENRGTSQSSMPMQMQTSSALGSSISHNMSQNKPQHGRQPLSNMPQNCNTPNNFGLGMAGQAPTPALQKNAPSMSSLLSMCQTPNVASPYPQQHHQQHQQQSQYATNRNGSSPSQQGKKSITPTTFGPARITLRTPPVNGRMGTIGSSPRNSGSGPSPRNTPGNGHPHQRRASPMNMSPMPNRAGSSQQSLSQMSGSRNSPYHRPQSKISQNLSSMSPSRPHHDTGNSGRPIQLSQPSRSSLLPRPNNLK